MVRLRKNRWYSAENQHRLGRQVTTNSRGMRRLVSLIFLLALVLLVMHRVSDPGVVRRAFQAVGVPLDREVVATTQQKLPSTGNDNALKKIQVKHKAGVDSLWMATCIDLVPRILETASPLMIEALAKFSFSTSGKSVHVHAPEPPRTDEIQTEFSVNLLAAELSSLSEVTQNLLESARSSLSAAQSPSKSEDASARAEMKEPPPANDQWLDLLNRFSEEWAALLTEIDRFYSDSQQDNRTIALPSHEMQTALANYLDNRLVHGLRDATPWRPKEILHSGECYSGETTTNIPPTMTRH